MIKWLKPYSPTLAAWHLTLETRADLVELTLRIFE
jgi:hypothetical protein